MGIVHKNLRDWAKNRSFCNTLRPNHVIGLDFRKLIGRGDAFTALDLTCKNPVS